jgi:nucleotide sugar dehydrogenase
MTPPADATGPLDPTGEDGAVLVVGAGKMGLPVAAVFASRGARVIVADVNDRVVAQINAGESPIDEPGVPDLVAEMVRLGRLRATTDTGAAAARSDVVVILVPVLLTGGHGPDLAIIRGVAATLAASIRRGTMIVVETTVPIGETRRLGAIVAGGGLRADDEFDLVFSPERVKSQLVLRNLQVNPKVVGGGTPEAAERAASFYRRYLGAPVDVVGSLETAEFVKLAGMIYRDVNIALANELAAYAEGFPIEFERARAAANTDGEAALLEPGIGVGGHCTPVYPHFVIADAVERGVPTRLTQLGRAVNDAQPERALERIEDAVGSLRGRRVAVLGLGFRPNVKEETMSPTVPVVRGLVARGAEAVVIDPLYTAAELAALGLPTGDLRAIDVAILVTAHPAFRDILPELAAAGCRVVYDGRRLWAPGEVRAAGLIHIAPGAAAERSETARSDQTTSR